MKVYIGDVSVEFAAGGVIVGYYVDDVYHEDTFGGEDEAIFFYAAEDMIAVAAAIYIAVKQSFTINPNDFDFEFASSAVADMAAEMA